MMKQYRGFLIDLDGTIYRGMEPIPAGKRFINRLQDNHVPFLLLTNNSTRTPQMVVDHLEHNFGIHVTTDNVYTSAMATADYLANRCKAQESSTVYPIGERGLKEALFQRGFKYDDVHPDYVVVGLDRDVTYHKFAVATLAVRRGAELIGTNADSNLPSEWGMIPSAGSLVTFMEYATQTKAQYIGKPEPQIMDEAVKRLVCPRESLAIVGDNYMTDIKAGINAQVDQILVYTGLSTPELVAAQSVAPTWEVQSLDEVPVNPHA